MNMSVGAGAVRLNQELPSLPNGTPTGAAQGPAAAGNLGGFVNRSAFDRAWDNNIVPPNIKPRPPMWALQLEGNTELVRQVNELLYSKTASPTDILSVMDLMKAKIMELAIDGETMALSDMTKRIENNQKLREKEMAIAKEKAQVAEKNKEWSNFWNIVKAVGSVVASAAMIAAGAVMVATGVGAAPGAIMMAYGVYSLVNSTMDLVDAIRTSQGKEPIGFRLTVGELAAWIAKQAGADEETQAYWRVGAELALAVIVTAATLGTAGASASASAAANIAKAAETGTKVAKAAETGAKLGKLLGMGANIVKGSAEVASGIMTIKNAKLKYEQAEIKSRLDQLQTLLDKLQADVEKSQELLKTLNETLMGIWDVAAERLQVLRDADRRVWGGGRGNMV
jgi:hypothetical protein